MRERLGPVLGAVVRERLDPLCRREVPFGTRGARQLVVRRVADERVDERVLRRTGDGGAVLAADELLPLERAKSSPSRHGSRSTAEASASDQKTFPCTAAVCSRSFSVAGSRSMRAAMIPCTDVGKPLVDPGARLTSSARKTLAWPCSTVERSCGWVPSAASLVSDP